MGNISFNMLRLSLALLSFAEKLHGLYFESVLCENREAKLNCSVGNTIDDINITIHDEQDVCSITDDVNKGTEIALDSTSYSYCIGQNSCVLTDKMLNVSSSVLEKTKKLLIKFDCVREDNDRYHKRLKSVCPLNMKAVNCNHNDRKIEIQSVELKQYSSFCEKQNKNRSCTECFQTKVNEACNGKQKCNQLTSNGCDDCSRLSKFAYISFSCKSSSNVPLLPADSYVEGVAVGAIIGLIIIVGVVVVSVWFVRRKKPDDKQYMAHHHENTDMADNIGNQNIALSANCNSEIPSNLELSNVNSKQNNYEMAKPMNESEKDNYVFHENQYDVSRGNNCSEPHQGIYSRAVDTVYDSASHSRQNNISDQTYDHAFGPTTEDNYDIAKN